MYAHLAEVKMDADNNLVILHIGSTHPAVVVPIPCSSQGDKYGDLATHRAIVICFEFFSGTFRPSVIDDRSMTEDEAALGRPTSLYTLGFVDYTPRILSRIRVLRLA